MPRVDVVPSWHVHRGTSQQSDIEHVAPMLLQVPPPVVPPVVVLLPIPQICVELVRTWQSVDSRHVNWSSVGELLQTWLAHASPACAWDTPHAISLVVQRSLQLFGVEPVVDVLDAVEVVDPVVPLPQAARNSTHEIRAAGRLKNIRCLPNREASSRHM